jgi:predicted metalloendopeptidase
MSMNTTSIKTAFAAALGKAFNVQSGQALYLPPAERVRVW